jgi:polyisoprenoid-binding protein YceI
MTTSTLPATGTYRLDPGQTEIGCDCRAMFGLFTVHGTFRLRQGRIGIDADPARSSVAAVIDAESYSSGNGTRDADVRSAILLDTGRHPEITFTSFAVRVDHDWVVEGSVTARGVTQPVQLQVTEVRLNGAAIRFRATATLDRTSFGITRKKGMVGRTVHLTIDTVAVPV